MIKKVGKGFIVFIGAILSVLLFFIVLSFIMEVFMPEGWLFYETNTIWAYIIATVCLLDLAHFAFSKKYREEVDQKFVMTSVILLVISTYIYASSITIVSDHHIIVKNPVNPIGTVYDYEDVEKINAYFSDDSWKNKLLQKPGGTFIYEISLDGKKFDFQTPSRNELYAETDTYSELEDFDQELVALGVQKVSSTENAGLNDLAQVYKHLFLRIIAND